MEEDYEGASHLIGHPGLTQYEEYRETAERLDREEDR